MRIIHSTVTHVSELDWHLTLLVIMSMTLLFLYLFAVFSLWL